MLLLLLLLLCDACRCQLTSRESGCVASPQLPTCLSQ